MSKAIYCTETQDRIPPEYFAQGKALFSGGKPYMADVAKRLGLKPDAAPPPEYAALISAGSAPAPKPAAVPPPLPQSPPAVQDSAVRAETKVDAKVAPPAPDAMTIADIKVPPLAPKPVEVKPQEVKASEVKPAEVKPPEAAVNKPLSAGVHPSETKSADTKPAETKPAAEAKPAEVKPAEAKPAAAPAAAAAAAKPAAPAAAATPAAAKPATPAPATPAAAAAPAAKPATPAAAAPAGAKPAAPAAGATPAAGAAPAAAKKPEAPRILAEARLDRGEPLSAQELLKIPIFEGIAQNALERLPGAVVKRTFKAGEIICREGEYGSTAFYILSGKAEVFINTPISHVESSKKEASTGGLFGIFRKFTHGLSGRKVDGKDENSREFIPNDGPADLSLTNPVAEMNPQDLFGEMTCLSFYPRSATVRAKEECVMLEMLRNVLQVLQKNKKFKEQLDKAYRERALSQHLRSVPIFKKLDDKFIDQLRNRVELVDFDPGEVIVKQGDVADAFYLVRVGCVKVSQNHPGGELVMTYLGRGEYFGEMGLLKGGKRTATCTALDHVEVVRIKKPDFEFMLSWYEDLRPKFVEESERREKQSRLMSERAPNVPLDDFLGQGLMHAQSLLLLDLEKCTRCDECVRACADSHDGVTRLVREGLRFDKYLVPTSCRSCMDPVCMIGCPVGSIRRKESLEIIIEDWCIGCGICAKQCPYGNISMHPFDVKVADPEKPGAMKAEIKEKAVTCDLCTELKEPSCVYACPHDAAHRVDARSFFMGQSK